MLGLGLGDVGLPVHGVGNGPTRVGIWTDELDRGEGDEPSYWVDTLRRARSLVPPEVSLSFVMGSDQLAAFAHWREPHEILRLASPIVLVRGGGGVEDGVEVDEALVERLLEPIRHPPAAMPAGDQRATWSAHEEALFKGGLLIGQPTMAVSSTRIREMLRTNPESPDLDQMLTPSVLALLRVENPYAEARPARRTDPAF